MPHLTDLTSFGPRRHRPRLAAAVGLFVVTLALAACASELSGPAAVVQEVLTMRRDRVTDAKRYDPLFADPKIGAQLAEDSAAATQTPLPPWSTPYVSEESSSSAKVVVVWSSGEERFKDWPKASIFLVQREKGAWVIADAQSATGTVPPPASTP